MRRLLWVQGQPFPHRRHHVIECRDPSWYTDVVFARLERYGVALCLHDMHGSASGMLTVGPFVYVPSHGVQKYSGSYSERTLDRWAEWLASRSRAGVLVYAYFNNDTGGHAPRDAVRLRDRIRMHVSS